MAGYSPEMEWADILHCLWLGVGRDAVGSHLMILARLDPALQEYTTYDERLRALHCQFRTWCCQHSIRPSTVEGFSIWTCVRLMVFMFLSDISVGSV